MELRLLEENDPLLKQIAEPWDFEKDGDPNELIREMVKLMFASQGIGLAATQCGILKRVLVMGNDDYLVACINPEIVEFGEEILMGDEGCLSFPDLWLKVKRPVNVKVKYHDIDGVLVEKEFTGMSSRIFQHELDHLNGITFDTKVGELSLQMAKDKRKKRKKKFNQM